LFGCAEHKAEQANQSSGLGFHQNNRLKNQFKSQVKAIGFPLPDQKRQPSNSKTRAHDTGREMLAQ
jgi:hypothetical protein